jgi:hypothetical protein
MRKTPRVSVSAAKNRGLHDIGQRIANKPGQGIVRDERGQEQPADKNRARQTDSKKEQSQREGPAAYAPQDEGEKKGRLP